MSADVLNARAKPFSGQDGTTPLQHVVTLANTSAPYLSTLIKHYPEIVTRLAEEPPEAIMTSLLVVPNARDVEGYREALRHVKKQVHLVCALCDIAEIWDWAIVTKYLSDFADMAMEVLFATIAAELGFMETERGPIPGMFVLALGKYGGQELNYSSDIDLTVFYDPDHIEIPEGKNPERILIRFVKTLMRAFDEITGDGYIFRTDLRLRPDPRSNAIAVSTRTGERYYESFGQNWERSAMIKARFVGGDEQAANAFIDNVLRPFVWRRTLDYAAISDIHSIKRQISKASTITNMALPGHNIKLGLGGIREIEFFVSVQQLILGGRHKALRTPRTIDALNALVKKGFVERAHAEVLEQSYAQLRRLEHRVQMLNDEQTHIWPEDINKRDSLARLCAAPDRLAYEWAQADMFKTVHRLYNDLFAEEDNLGSTCGSLVFTGVEAEDETLKTLNALGYERGGEVWGLMADWLGGRIRATRTPRARELLTRLAPRIVELCAQTGAADTAFFNFAAFMGNLNSGVSLFSFLVNRDEVLAALINLLALSSKLATTLAQYPEQIESMLDMDFARQSRFNCVDYNDIIDETDDFETAINALRRAVHEDQLSLTALVLNSGNTQFARTELSQIAEKALQCACKIAERETIAKVGAKPDAYGIIGMGKLAGHELTLSSDLDIVIVYAGEDANPWYNKFTRRLISAVSSVTQDGKLYEIDMALRPSGRAGLLSAPLGAFSKYYETKAWTWEFMALSKARIVVGSNPEFAKTVEAKITKIFQKAPKDPSLGEDVASMLTRLKSEKPARHDWDIKRMDGGLRDIEFVAQYQTLKAQPKQWPKATRDMLMMARGENDICAEDIDMLVRAHDLYGSILQIMSMVNAKNTDPRKTSSLTQSLLAAATGHADFVTLDVDFQHIQARVHEIVMSVFNSV